MALRHRLQYFDAVAVPASWHDGLDDKPTSMVVTRKATTPERKVYSGSDLRFEPKKQPKQRICSLKYALRRKWYTVIISWSPSTTVDGPDDVAIDRATVQNFDSLFATIFN